MAHLCKLVNRGALQTNYLALSMGSKAWPNSPMVDHLAYNSWGREFEACSGRSFIALSLFRDKSSEIIIIIIIIIIQLFTVGRST